MKWPPPRKWTRKDTADLLYWLTFALVLTFVTVITILMATGEMAIRSGGMP